MPRDRPPDRWPARRSSSPGTLDSHEPRGRPKPPSRRSARRSPSSVSKKTTAVIVGRDPGSKADKARAAGVPVLDEAAFLRPYNELDRHESLCGRARGIHRRRRLSARPRRDGQPAAHGQRPAGTAPNPTRRQSPLSSARWPRGVRARRRARRLCGGRGPRECRGRQRRRRGSRRRPIADRTPVAARHGRRSERAARRLGQRVHHRRAAVTSSRTSTSSTAPTA